MGNCRLTIDNNPLPPIDNRQSAIDNDHQRSLSFLRLLG